MKLYSFVASCCLGMGFSSATSAEVFTAVNDPSGAPMCFDDSGAKAPLAACDESPFAIFVSHSDPTGAAMCFTSTGKKAPLARCASEETSVVAHRQDAPLAAPAKISTFDALVSFP